MGRIHAILASGTIVTDVEVCLPSPKTIYNSFFFVNFILGSNSYVVEKKILFENIDRNNHSCFPGLRIENSNFKSAIYSTQLPDQEIKSKQFNL